MAALASASVPRRRRGLTTQVPVALAALSIVLVAWEVVARTVLAQSEFVPTVGEVIDALAGLHNSGALWTSLAVTLQEFFVGLVIGLLGGLAIGVALAESHHADRLFSPSIWAIYGVPRVAFLPLLLIWFGTGLGSKVALVIIGVIFPVISSTYNGIRQTVPSHLNAAHSMLTSRRETFIKVYLPCCLISSKAHAKARRGASSEPSLPRCTSPRVVSVIW